ncbi:MAG TPA: NUDIX domain-containing protein [Candidatus Saccharimonadales bacterium]|nr:NUDIX domain-containing protein [Candidatus Saccharimonadales bacterium]
MADSKIATVDENDRVIGAASFERVYGEGLWHRIVRVLVFNTKGELLLQKRGPRVMAPDKWDQSVGGHVDAGEDYLDAVVRETHEELGIVAAPKDFQVVGNFAISRNESRGRARRFNRIYRLAYNGPIRFNPDEITEVCWITPDKLREWISSKPNDFTRDIPRVLDIYLASVEKAAN